MHTLLKSYAYSPQITYENIKSTNLHLPKPATSVIRPILEADVAWGSTAFKTTGLAYKCKGSTLDVTTTY